MDLKKMREEVPKFIRENNVMVVSTVSPEGVPQAATVNFLFDEDFSLYFATGKETKKAKNLQYNKRVAFVIGTGPAVITVQGGGLVTEIDGQNLGEKGKIGSELYLKANQEWPVLKLSHTGISFFKITPDWLVFLNLDKEGHPETYSQEYHKII